MLIFNSLFINFPSLIVSVFVFSRLQQLQWWNGKAIRLSNSNFNILVLHYFGGVENQKNMSNDFEVLCRETLK